LALHVAPTPTNQPAEAQDGDLAGAVPSLEWNWSV